MKKLIPYGIVLIGILLLVILGVQYLVSSRPKVDYTGQIIYQTNVPVELKGGKVRVVIDDVRAGKLVAFSYNKKSPAIPLLAYVAPSGNVVAAIRLCEPCNSTSFRIEGNNLICNVCNTNWRLEDLKGISGGCTLYPPEKLQASINGNYLEISEQDLLRWKPRI